MDDQLGQGRGAAEVQPTVRERVELLSVLNEAAKASEALRAALRALRWYADERNWSEDDWGCVAVIRHPDYGEGGKKARNAIKRIEQLTRPDRVASALRDEAGWPTMPDLGNNEVIKDRLLACLDETLYEQRAHVAIHWPHDLAEPDNKGRRPKRDNARTIR